MYLLTRDACMKYIADYIVIINVFCNNNVGFLVIIQCFS